MKKKIITRKTSLQEKLFFREDKNDVGQKVSYINKGRTLEKD